MSSQLLLLDRVEFSTIKVESLRGNFPLDQSFPQLAIDPEKVNFLTRSELIFPEDQASDPRHFALTYGVKVSREDAPADQVPPYEIEVEAVGYFRYMGDDAYQGADRFRAVYFSGYQILHGAIREMVCNLTARGRHGLWNLPARSFGGIAKERAEQDEERRQQLLARASATTAAIEAPKPARKRAPRKSAKKSAD
jgi:hypothetical protein